MPRPLPDVYTLAEVAAAAGASPERAADVADSFAPLSSRWFSEADAVRAVRLLRSGVERNRGLFASPASPAAQLRVPVLASTGGHVIALAVLALISAAGLSAPVVREPIEFKPARMVFLALPGPGGGGGGGGGARQRPPVARAALKGRSTTPSPMPPPRVVRSQTPRPETPAPAPPAQPKPVETPAPPPDPVPHADPAPPVTAPVAPVAADPNDRAGTLNGAREGGSRGSGEGGGTGTGSGTGMGEGDGSGVGPGSGGGTGGGPYRPGAGITPPSLLREVKPVYTEEARRRGVEGEVVLEIVVRRDGTVGSVRVLRGLGAGLEARATEAVRQWRFAPARRHGTPVDVLVEVAVDFRFR